MFIFSFSFYLNAQVKDNYKIVSDDEERIIKNAVNDYYKDNYKCWKSGRSSVLIENNKSADAYELNNISDNNLSTAWVEGVKGSGIGQYVLYLVPEFDDGDYCYFKYKDKDVKVIFKINNGFCKLESLFEKNNRVKKVNIKIYDVPLTVGQNETYVSDVPKVLFENNIELDDSMKEQNFSFLIHIGENEKATRPEILLKFTILDVYKGTAYDDTCISEMHVYGEYEN